MAEGVASYTASAGALPTLVQLRSRVYAVLRDSSHSYVEEWFVTQLLNEAYGDLVARLRLYKKTVSDTTTASGTIALPTDLLMVENIWVVDADSNTLTVQFVGDDLFLSWAMPGVDSPFKYIARVNVGDGFIETYPALESLAYTMEYLARPAEMVAEDDAPDQLTRELIPRIVNYARAYAKWQEGEEAEGQRYMALYEQGLPGAPREAFRRNPGPMTLIPEAGPFDA